MGSNAEQIKWKRNKVTGINGKERQRQGSTRKVNGTKEGKRDANGKEQCKARKRTHRDAKESKRGHRQHRLVGGAVGCDLVYLRRPFTASHADALFAGVRIAV